MDWCPNFHAKGLEFGCHCVRGSCSSTFSLPASSVGLGLSKIVGATNKWLRKRLELEKEGQIITPTLHLLHVSVTLRSLDQKKWETKEERDRGKVAADFYLCSAGFDLQADEGREM